MLDDLTTRRFDLLIIGAGIHGAFAAWDAAARGLSVALVERGDFGAATSANSLKIVHGGFRYLQHGNLARVRQSAAERAHLTRMAPHLVSPLACVVPTTHGLRRSRLAFRAALAAYDVATSGISVARPVGRPTNRAEARGKPGQGRILSPREYRELAGPFADRRATGAALWWDGQLESPDRFLLGVVQAARALGAAAANYVDVVGLLRGPTGVAGATVQSADGMTADVAARMVLIAANDASTLLAPVASDRRGADSRPLPFALAANIVTAHPPQPAAVAIPTIGRSRMLFAVPWRGRTMIGTTQHDVTDQDAYGALDAAVTALVREIEVACPDAGIDRDAVTLVHRGRLPGTAERLIEEPILVDHAARDGVSGVVTMIGVKWTTARRTAERAVDLCVGRLGVSAGVCTTNRTALSSGASAPLASESKQHHALPPEIRARLSVLYGDRDRDVLSLANERPELAEPLPGSLTIGAQLVYGIQHEMAHHLDDLVLRRTELGTTGHPGGEALDAAARIAAADLRWSPERTAAEVAHVDSLYPTR